MLSGGNCAYLALYRPSLASHPRT